MRKEDVLYASCDLYVEVCSRAVGILVADAHEEEARAPARVALDAEPGDPERRDLVVRGMHHRHDMQTHELVMLVSLLLRVRRYVEILPLEGIEDDVGEVRDRRHGRPS